MQNNRASELYIDMLEINEKVNNKPVTIDNIYINAQITVT